MGEPRDELPNVLLAEDGFAAGFGRRIARRPDPRMAPLSWSQQRLWVLDRIEPESAAYNVALTVRSPESLGDVALERALQRLVDRHEILRTCFQQHNGEAFQVIHGPPDRIALERIEAPAAEGEAAERFLRSSAERLALRRFDLANEAPMRAALFCLAGGERVLLLVFHHIAVDKWSLDILLRDLSVLYDNEIGQTASLLPPVPIQYGDYAAWQRSPEIVEEGKPGLDYWIGRLAGAPESINFLHDASLRESSGAGAVERFSTGPQISAGLGAFSSRHGVTPFMTLLAVFTTLLSKISGDVDLCVGTPVANRRLAETHDVAGFFVNTIVLRSDLSGDPSFLDFLLQCRNNWIEDFERGDTPFEAIVEKLHVTRTPGRNPLFQVMFQFEKEPSLDAAERRLRGERSDLPVSMFDLTLEIEQTGQQLSGRLEYRRDLFGERFARRLWRQFETLLRAALANPRTRVSALPFSPAEDILEALAETDATGRNRPVPDGSIAEAFQRRVAAQPDAVALIAPGGTVSYAELAERSCQLAHRLLALSVKAEEPVAICIPRSPDLIVAMLAVLDAGAVPVPMDPDHPPRMLAYILDDCGARVVLTLARFSSVLPVSMAQICVDRDWPEIARLPSSEPPRRTHPLSAAYILYTSGSTGMPKGVVGLHAATLNRLQWMWRAWPFEPAEVCCQKTTVTFVDSVWEIFGPLLAGAPLAILDTFTASDPHRLVAALASHNISRLVLVPSLLRDLLHAEPRLGERLPKLRIVVSSGEALPSELARALHGAAPACRLLNLYGSTEVAGDATWFEVPLDANGSVPIGRPLDGLAIRILDSHGMAVPAGVRGEIYVAGSGLARGYYNRPAQTAERFLPDPYGAPGSRMYRTGDLGCLRSDGLIEFLGRSDRQIKIRGVRIEPREVEAALTACAGVKSAAVVSRPGERQQVDLVAYIEAEPGTVTSAGLRSSLRSLLPTPMIPSKFVIVDRLPLNTSGKVDLSGLPDASEGGESEAGTDGALNMVEEIVATVWRELLGIRRLHPDADFFDMGGQSLLAIRAVAKINEVLDCGLAPSVVFEAPTVRELALKVNNARAGASLPPIGKAAGLSNIPASFAQRRAWFLSYLERGSAVDNLAAAYRLKGRMDETALTNSLLAVAARHEILRTRLEEAGGELCQVIDLPESVTVGIGAAESFSEACKKFEAEASLPFDLRSTHPVRFRLFRIADDEWLLGIVLHHAACDAWSGTIIVRDLSRIYAALAKGMQVSLPQPLFRYADYALWQHDLRKTRLGAEHLDWWRDELAGAPMRLLLPADYPRTEASVRHCGREPVLLSAEMVDRLRALDTKPATTLFSILLTAFGVLVVRYSGQRDILIGTPVAGRDRIEFHDIVGAFANNLIVRLDVTDDPAFHTLLRRVRQKLLAAMDHQDVPFDLLVEALRPPRNGSDFPVFQTMFVFEERHSRIPELPEIDTDLVDIENAWTRFDLSLILRQEKNGIAGFLEYPTDLFSRDTMRRIAGNFEELLRSVLANPDAKVSELNIVSVRERDQLRWWAQAPDAAAATEAAVDRLLASQAAARPDSIAILFENRGLTYGQLEIEANRLARFLPTRGVHRSERVAVCLDRSPDLIVAILAVFRAGAVYVPLDPSHPDDRLTSAVRESGAGVLICSVETRDRAELRKSVATVVDLDRERENIGQSSGEPVPPATSGSAWAAIIHTSGSTGKPKGAVITHRSLSLLASSLSKELGIGPGKRLLQTAAIAFDVALSDVVMTLAGGGTLCLARREDLLPGPPLLRTLRQTRATHMQIPSSLLAAMDPEPLPDLAVIVVGGEVCRTDTARMWSRGRRFLNAYGPTETTVTATMGEYDGSASRLSIGQPIAGSRVYVLDPHCRPAPIGVAGEIYIAGAGVSDGYLGRALETAERFIPDPNPAFPGQRMFRTGDRGRWSHTGELEFLGRIDRQIKIRGFRVEPAEIETTLAAVPGVHRAVVALRQGNGSDEHLVAYLIPRPDGTFRLGAVRPALRAALPEYMIPARFVTLPSVPLTPNGKIDWAALPEPAPGENDASEWSPAAAPASEIERQILEVWRRVLRRSDIGVDDNFFDCGGQSLLLVRVHTDLTALLQREITVPDLFRYPTVRALARSLIGTPPAAVPREPDRRASRDGASEAIAIIGMACRFPGAPDLDSFWKLVSEGRDAISRFTEEELVLAGVDVQTVRRPDFVPANGVVPNADLFDAAFFGFSPHEAEILDPQHRILLETAWHALEDAGYGPGSIGEPVGVFAGSGLNTYLRSNVYTDGNLPGGGLGYQALIGNDKDFVPALIAYKLDLKGPAIAVQTGCSTSLVAVDQACQNLRSGRCSMALAGGVSIQFPEISGYVHEPGMILSPDGQCRAFDAEARGTVRSGGAAIVVLKRLSAALADGDPIRAVILGSAVNNDGRAKVGFTAPGVDGQAAVISAALQAAGIKPDSISYIEAHGTGTELGDPVEMAALSQVFPPRSSSRIAIGSVKTNIGHPDTAAGVAGLIKTVLALEHGLLPPSLHFTAPNPRIDFARSAFEVNTVLRPWDSDGAPRRAGVSSFGIGGTNAHVVLEEAPRRVGEANSGTSTAHAFVLSAKTEAALAAAGSALADSLRKHPDLDPADVAFTLQTGRTAFACRRAVIASSLYDAADLLEKPPLDSRIASGNSESGELAGLFGIAKRWCAGTGVDWAALHNGRKPRRISLPGYAFERQRYWREPRTGTGVLKKHADPGRWFYLPGWIQTPFAPTASAEPESYLLLGAETELGRDLAGLLSARGNSVIEVRAGSRLTHKSGLTPKNGSEFTIDMASERDYLALLSQLARTRGLPSRIVHLWSTEAPSGSRPADELQRGLYSLTALAAATGVSAHTQDLSITFVSTGAQSVTGAEKLRPAAAAALGPVKVVPLEQSQVSCRVVDVETTASGTFERRRLLDQLLHEFSAGHTDPVVALRGPSRWIPHLSSVDLAPSGAGQDRLRQKGVYLITGGLGGIGLTLARHLAQTLAARMILVGRTGLPCRADWANVQDERMRDRIEAIREMESAGSEILVRSANVADFDAMSAVVEEAHSRFGAIHGVIHAAGLADFGGILAKRRPDSLASVMEPKVHGTLVLERVLNIAELDFFALFSTLGSVVHHTKFGQAGYAAANEFLDLYAPARAAKGEPCIVINWDDWAGDGMSEEAARRHGGHLDPGNCLTPAEGALAFRMALSSGYSRLAVSVRPLNELIRCGSQLQQERLRAAAPCLHPRPLAVESFIEAGTTTQRAVAEIWQNCLGLQQVGICDDFFALGGDSLLATQITSAVRCRFGIDLPLSSIFDYSTVESMAAQIDLTRDSSKEAPVEEFRL